MIPPPARTSGDRTMLPAGGSPVGRVWVVAVIGALLLVACPQRSGQDARGVSSPTPAASPITVTPSPTSTLPFAPTADCEDATVGGAMATVRMEDNLFDPACVVILGGQGLRLVNRGANLHNLSIEGTQVALDVPPGDTQRTEPLGQVVDPGTYTYFCEYHRHLGMEGDITVTAVG